MQVWREVKPSPLACTRVALREGGLSKRSVLVAGVLRARAAWWVLGALPSRVPLGALSSRVPLGALSSRVPLGALSSWIPLGVLSSRVPLGALSSRVPLGALSFQVLLGVPPSSWVLLLVVAESSLLAINPVMVAPLRLPHPNLITSQRPHLHILSHQRLRLQYMNFEGTQTFRRAQRFIEHLVSANSLIIIIC